MIDSSSNSTSVMPLCFFILCVPRRTYLSPWSIITMADTYIHTYIHTYTYTHLHTHTHLQPYRNRHTASRPSLRSPGKTRLKHSPITRGKSGRKGVPCMRNIPWVSIQLRSLVHVNRPPLIRFPEENPLHHIGIICINHGLVPFLPSPFIFPSNDK